MKMSAASSGSQPPARSGTSAGCLCRRPSRRVYVRHGRSGPTNGDYGTVSRGNRGVTSTLVKRLHCACTRQLWQGHTTLRGTNSAPGQDHRSAQPPREEHFDGLNFLTSGPPVHGVVLVKGPTTFPTTAGGWTTLDMAAEASDIEGVSDSSGKPDECEFGRCSLPGR